MHKVFDLHGAAVKPSQKVGITPGHTCELAAWPSPQGQQKQPCLFGCFLPGRTLIVRKFCKLATWKAYESP